MIRTNASTKALYGVIAGGSRRTDKVVVSSLYPYLWDDTFTANMPAVTEIGRPFAPRDYFNVAMPTVSAIVLRQPVIHRDVPSDEFGVNMPTVQAITVKTIVVRESIPNDEFGVNMPTVTAITVKRVALRENVPNDEFTVDMPTVTSIVLGS